jgi:hypothetical protein
MAAPLMSNASKATPGTSPEGRPVFGSSWPLGDRVANHVVPTRGAIAACGRCSSSARLSGSSGSSSGGIVVGGSTRCPTSGGTRRSRCPRTSGGGAGGSPCRSATVLDTHYVSRPAFSALRINVYHELIRVGGRSR